MNRVLIVSAHPDDDILGCGGLMSRLKNSTEFKVVFIGEGTSCRYNEPNDSDSVEKEIKIRNAFGIEALEYLGINRYSFYNLPCGRFDQEPLIKINKIIENEIDDFKPDTVFTHSDIDSNKDHVKVFNSVIIATRPGLGVNKVYSFEVLSSTEWGFSKAFTPNMFFELSEEDVECKSRALKKYKSEIRNPPHPRNKRGIYTLAKYRGMQSGNEYAEAFQVIREIA